MLKLLWEGGMWWDRGELGKLLWNTQSVLNRGKLLWGKLLWRKLLWDLGCIIISIVRWGRWISLPWHVGGTADDRVLAYKAVDV